MTVQLPDNFTLTQKPTTVKQHQSSYKPKVSADKPFIAWDGEGYTDEHGTHHLMLWGCSTGEHVIGESLTAADCFNLLLTVAAKQKANHVIFAGGYDLVMMIHKFPSKGYKDENGIYHQSVCERIMHGHVTWYNGYRIEYYKSKFLKLSDGSRSIILYDVFTFFSTSFVKACREYLGEHSDFDRIEQTKLVRDGFTMASLTEQVIPYWQEELKYLVQLMDTLRKRLLDAGINTRQWHGPGAIASTVLRDRGITAHMAHTPESVCEAARHAYYGGRFEQHQIGYANGPIYQYDIRSAYPAAIVRLPSLANLTWVHRPHTKPNRLKPYGIYQISYTAGSSSTTRDAHPLPWRDTDRAIYYPPDIYKSWYWGIELQTAVRLTPGAIWEVHDGWEPRTNPIDYPFQWVNTMYEERAAAKRRGDPVQLAQKLALNSLYGKLAQSKGAKQRDNEWQLPRYHQLEWAGWITAATRATIFDAICRASSGLIAVETDAIYSTRPVDLSVSTQLGGWELDISEAILYVQSGVYFKQVGGSWKLKSRGFTPRNESYEKFKAIFDRLPSPTPLTIASASRRFGTDPKTQHFAQWYEQQRSMEVLSSSSKRIHKQDTCEPCLQGLTLGDTLHPLHVPIERINSSQHSSTPHHLPWIKDTTPWEEEWFVMEDGFIQYLYDDEATL